MDYDEISREHRAGLTVEQRNADMRLRIDPGFVHTRKIETVIGPEYMKLLDDEIRRLPDALPDHMRRMRVNNIYSRVLLRFCNAHEAPTLSELIGAGRGRLFCSIIEVEAAPELYQDVKQAVSRIVVPGVDSPVVELHYSTEHIVGDTLRTCLAQGHTISVIAEQFDYRDGKLIFRPLVMGGTWLYPPSEDDPLGGAAWYGGAFFENFIEDVDQFAAVKGVPTPAAADIDVMREISERAFKTCLVELLGDDPKADWGGEVSDHFTSHLNLSGKRLTAAFLLKGPAHFAPMGLNHLGKNNDQILRLAKEPAELLVVQHSHEILPPVREFLRLVAVQPGAPRRYLLIDGRDSLRLLTAYDMVDKARALTAAERTTRRARSRKS